MMRYILAFIAVSVLAVVSCTSPFSARDSEDPYETEGTFYTPVEPELVLINLEFAYNETVITNYAQCLDTVFFYKYDFLLFPQDSDSGWLYGSEMLLTDKIFATYRSGADTMTMKLRLTELESRPDFREDTLAVLYREYNLTTIAGTHRPDPDTIIYKGTSTFEVVQADVSLWMLRRWEDQHSTPQDVGWADFKNGFRR